MASRTTDHTTSCFPLTFKSPVLNPLSDHDFSGKKRIGPAVCSLQLKHLIPASCWNPFFVVSSRFGRKTETRQWPQTAGTPGGGCCYWWRVLLLVAVVATCGRRIDNWSTRLATLLQFSISHVQASSEPFTSCIAHLDPPPLLFTQQMGPVFIARCILQLVAEEEGRMQSEAIRNISSLWCKELLLHVTK